MATKAQKEKNSAEWRAEAVHEYRLHLESLVHAWGELHAEDRALIEKFTQFDFDAMMARAELLRKAAQKREVQLRAEADAKRKATHHALNKAVCVLVQFGPVLTLVLDYFNIIDLGIV